MPRSNDKDDQEAARETFQAADKGDPEALDAIQRDGE